MLRSVPDDPGKPIPLDEANVEFAKNWTAAREAYLDLLGALSAAGQPLFTKGPISVAVIRHASYDAERVAAASRTLRAAIADCIDIATRVDP